MHDRKSQLEAVIANFQSMKNKMHATIMKKEKEGHVTRSQMFVLAILERSEDTNVKMVANRLNISSSAATQLLEGLVEKGYVLRKTDTQDRRAIHLVLSAKGKKQVIKLKNQHIQALTNFFDGVTDAELSVYLTVQEKILTNMNEKE